jgi:hypothetical protein
MTYNARKLAGARVQIGLLRSALFTLENRLVCGADRDPVVVVLIRTLYRDVGALEDRLAALPTTDVETALDVTAEGATLQ